jgi:hypothetical protein
MRVDWPLEDPLISKKIAALSALALTASLLSGCSITNEVASLMPYAPSDGVQLDVADLKARNVMLIEKTPGQVVLIGSFVNSSKQAISAQLQTTDASGEVIRVAFEVGPQAKFDLGYNGTEPLAFELDTKEKFKPGSMHQVYLSAGSDPVGMLVPIMDGSLAEYRPFID